MCNMKDSHVEWLGKIPVNWEIGRIKDYYKFQTGFTPDTTRVDYYDDENGHIWVSIADINERERYIYDSKAKISDLYVKEKRPLITNEGSLLYSFKLSVGKKIFAGKDLYTNEAIGSFIDENRVNLNFLYYSSFLIEENANINIYGAKLLNSTLISNSYTIFPPLEEQRLIAEFLDSEVGKINEAITKIEKQIEILEEYKKSLIAETVTKGLDKTAVYKDTGIDWIGEIPENWEVKRARYVVNFKTGGTPPEKRGIVDEGEIPWITAPDMDQGFDLIEANNYITPSAVNENKYSLFPAGSILFVCIASVGKLGITHTDSYSNQQITALMPVNIESRFLLYYMSFASGKIIKDASSNVVPIVNTSYLKNLSIILPSKKEQNEISGYLDDKLKHIDAVISFKRKQNKKIKDIKDSLIYEYVTGKKRVGG